LITIVAAAIGYMPPWNPSVSHRQQSMRRIGDHALPSPTLLDLMVYLRPKAGLGLNAAAL
jgi:hypothetical protein